MAQFYKLYLLNEKRHISHAYDFMGVDDAAAIREAKKYSEKQDVEVWQGSRLVERIARDAKSASG